jgi:hypothetical protein
LWFGCLRRPFRNLGPSTTEHNILWSITGSSALAGLEGQEITVQLADTGRRQIGTHAAFFARQWLYGESIAVQEVGREATDQDTSAARQRVAAIVAGLPEQALRQRLASAGAVIAG